MRDSPGSRTSRRPAPAALGLLVAFGGRMRFGVRDVHAGTDPGAAEGCDRRAFPARTTLFSMTAAVPAGDAPPVP
jgi:hypothetical protein